MELIAASRIAKAQQRVAAAQPYAQAITGVLTSLASNSNVDHPMLTPPGGSRRAAVLVVTSDRGLAGGYNANVLRRAEELSAFLREHDIEPILYVVGRKGVGFYSFRRRPIAASWTGFSEQPHYSDAQECGNEVVRAFERGRTDRDGAGSTDEGTDTAAQHEGPSVDEVHIVHTEYVSALVQRPTSHRVVPMEVEERDIADAPEGLLPDYEFEPEADALLDALLPKYINTRIYAAMLESAAAESAARQRAMKAATDNADDLVTALTREANSARQAEITQEISEIVGGANALAEAGSDRT